MHKPMTDSTAAGELGGQVWDKLYRRGFDGVQRSPAEVDSIPIPDSWGVMPDSEVEANEFLIRLALISCRWLDLGCGTGSVTAAMLRKSTGATATGIDASVVAIEHGKRMAQADPELAGRLKLVVGDIAAPPVLATERFDLIYALFSLQFLRPHETAHLLSSSIGPALAPGGVFAGTVRSVNRSIPASYERRWPQEPYSFASNEPHERGLIYHHYSEDEVMEFAIHLGGRVKMLKEKRSIREYDPAPVRAWWDFVFVRH